MGKLGKEKSRDIAPEARITARDGTNKDKVYQLKISLAYSKPEIWRRILVSGDTTLGKLHRVIQVVMGWTDSHLHQFAVKGVSYADPDPEMGMDGSKSENRARLYQVVPNARASFMYVYDFGDDWAHKITAEKIMNRHERFTGLPVCLEGRLASPPEDCGGIDGFYHMLEIIKNPKDPEYENMIEWLGDDFNPEVFDLEEINEILRRIR
jgi:hypothetical protein